MADNSRRYNLDVCSLISYGIGSSGTSYQCSILEAFNVVIDGTVCNYPSITAEGVGLLSVPAYEERVSDYLDYINIESDITKERLIEDAQDDDPACDNPCQLNPEFLVYRFLTGVRVVDIGDTYGVAQYRAYPVGDDPNLYSWQESPTFLNVDLLKTYIFDVRDYYDYAEYCVVSRAVSLPSLVPSTTYSVPDVTVFLEPLAAGSSGPMEYKTGFVRANVVSTGLPLSGVEKVQVNFIGGAEASGDATGYALLKCQTAGSGSFNEIFNIDDTDYSPQSGGFLMQAADVVCYHLQTIVPTCGSCACTCIDLTTVDGQSLTNPTINLSACCVDITCSKPPLTISVKTEQTTDSTNKAGTSCIQNGRFLFNNLTGATAVAVGQTLEVELCARITFLNHGTGSAEILCSPLSTSLFSSVVNHTQANAQPRIGTINIQHGDCLCYRLTTNVAAEAGAEATSSFCINDLDATYGIAPVIGLPKGDSMYQAPVALT